LIASVVGVLTFTVPALAADTGSTPATITIDSGTLDISVPASTAQLVNTVGLRALQPSTDPQKATAELGLVTVTDGRGVNGGGWTVTASAEDFTTANTVPIPATSATPTTSATAAPVLTIPVAGPTGMSSYDAPVVTQGGPGTAILTKSGLFPLYPGGTVLSASEVVGMNTARWKPIIYVTVPPNTLVGTYSSTVTHSVI
jgi:hypothetical protein